MASLRLFLRPMLVVDPRMVGHEALIHHEADLDWPIGHKILLHIASALDGIRGLGHGPGKALRIGACGRTALSFASTSCIRHASVCDDAGAGKVLPSRRQHASTAAVVVCV